MNDEYFSNIKDILAGTHFKSINPVFSDIVNDWENLVGKKFANKTEISEIYNKTNKYFMLVHVKSSPIVQELTFFKLSIIRKIKEKYNFDIEDIIIKLKPKNAENTLSFKQNVIQEVFDQRPTDDELNRIILNEKTVEEITISINKQNNLDEKQKKRMFEIIIKDLKTQEWMKQKGFPVCKICGRVMTRKNFGDEIICHFCKTNGTL